MSIYTPIGCIGHHLEFYNSVTMYLTHSIRKNKVNVDSEFNFYCMLMMEIVVVALVLLLLSNYIRQSQLLIYFAKEDPYLLEFSEYRYFKGSFYCHQF